MLLLRFSIKIVLINNKVEQLCIKNLCYVKTENTVVKHLSYVFNLSTRALSSFRNRMTIKRARLSDVSKKKKKIVSSV